MIDRTRHAIAMTNYYKRIRRQYEERWGHLNQALSEHAVDAILEALLAASSEDAIMEALEDSRFANPGQYRSTVERLREIAVSRKGEEKDDPEPESA